MTDSNQRYQPITTTVTRTIASAIAVYSFYVLGIGIMAERAYTLSATLQGGLILIGALLVLAGSLRSNSWLAWSGVGILTATALVFLFGAGAVLLPVVGLLLFCLLYDLRTKN